MAKKTKISQEDLDAFHEAVKDAKPLSQNKIRLKSPQPVRKRKAIDDLEWEPLNLSEAQDLGQVRGEEFIGYKQAAISNKTLRKLRKGQYNVDAMLDLHGMSVEEAKSAVESFLQQCLQRSIRVALIIHGKGRHTEMPILKNKLNHWLRDIHLVLAFCSAAPSHGNRGAIYVLLKRNTEETIA